MVYFAIVVEQSTLPPSAAYIVAFFADIDYNALTDGILSAMRKGLRGEEGGLAMLPTYLSDVGTVPEDAPVIQTVSIYLYREMSGMGLSYSPRSSLSLMSLKADRVYSTSSIEWAAVGMMRKMTMPSGMTG